MERSETLLFVISMVFNVFAYVRWSWCRVSSTLFVSFATQLLLQHSILVYLSAHGRHPFSALIVTLVDKYPGDFFIRRIQVKSYFNTLELASTTWLSGLPR